MSDYREFANLLDHYLAKAERPATWLAQRLGVNPATVTRWRNGETRPNSPELVRRIADALAIPPAERQQLLRAAGYAYLEQRPYSNGGAAPVGHAPSLAVKNAPGAAMLHTAAPGSARETTLDEPIPMLVAETDPQSGRIGMEWRRVLRRTGALPGVRSGVVILIVILLALWVLASQSKLRPEVGVQRFAIGDWQNLSPGASPYERALTEETRQFLYEKLSLVTALQGIAWRSPQVTDEARRTLDLWIEGSYQNLGDVQLTAVIYGRAGVYLDTVTVQGGVSGDAAAAHICTLDLQNQLAGAILSMLQIPVAPGIVEAMRTVPTVSCEALQLNNTAADLVMQGSLDGGRALLEKALALDPNYADAHNNLGQVFYRQQDWNAALAHQRRALALQPRNAVYHYNLGLVHERRGEYTAAIQAYEQALALDPIYVQALNNLGFTLLLTGEFTQATTVLERGLALEPKAPYLHNNLGRVYLAQGDPTSAIAEFHLVTQLSQGLYPEALYYLAFAHQQLQQTAEACAALAAYRKVADQDEPGRAEQAAQLASVLPCPDKSR